MANSAIPNPIVNFESIFENIKYPLGIPIIISERGAGKSTFLKSLIEGRPKGTKVWIIFPNKFMTYNYYKGKKFDLSNGIMITFLSVDQFKENFFLSSNVDEIYLEEPFMMDLSFLQQYNPSLLDKIKLGVGTITGPSIVYI